MGTKLMQRWGEFWRARNPRERAVLQIGGAVLLLAALYAAYVPLEAARARLSDRLPHMRAEHRLVMAQAEEIRSLSSAPVRVQEGDGDLLRRVEASARAMGLRDGEYRLLRVGSDLVRFEAAPRPARAWLEWIAELQRQAVRVRSARLTMAGDADRAGIELVLALGAP